MTKTLRSTYLDTQGRQKSLNAQGSIHKLQRAMGHSSLNVSLAYLRGLEAAELKEEDMPMV